MQLIVTELVTNARKHAPGPSILTQEPIEGPIHVTMGDSDPALPIPRAPDPDRLGQHRPQIILAVSEGFTPRREPVGKRITATITLADDRLGTPDAPHHCVPPRLQSIQRPRPAGAASSPAPGGASTGARLKRSGRRASRPRSRCRRRTTHRSRSGAAAAQAEAEAR
ncbi:hypothetical protein GCM10017752_00420 [Streptomyces roseoviridis]